MHYEASSIRDGGWRTCNACQVDFEVSGPDTHPPKWGRLALFWLWVSYRTGALHNWTLRRIERRRSGP